MILGFAYKANTSDFRNTKVIDVYNELKSFGLEVDIYDPLVNVEEVENKHRINIVSKCNEREYHLVLKTVNHTVFENTQSLVLKNLLCS